MIALSMTVIGVFMKIQIILGSTRPGRISPQIAQWVLSRLPKKPGITYELVDIAEYDLPLFNEPMHPMTGQYSHSHTNKWSEKITEADGFIFITAEYNGGMPTSLKNAIDYLYREWTTKPAMIVSYGVQGGIGAASQLRQAFTVLKIKASGAAALTITREMYGEDGQLKNPDTDFKPYEGALSETAEELLASL